MQFLSRIETEAAIVNGVANPSSTPVLTALNIFNIVKLEKLITCINANFDSTIIYLFVFGRRYYITYNY